MTYVLEINDSELALYRDSVLEYHAPAIAVVRQAEILFGEPALRLSRTHPRETNQHYFARLNADPLSHPVARAANHADLVYLHLQELGAVMQLNPADVVLAVPGMLSPDQLGVLLGIAQECGFKVGGFVDSAVVAAATTELPPTACHIDLHLQRACVTRLEIDSQVRRVGAEEVAECGFANLLDGWVNVIADRFVRDTRFDPLHAAETEQQLYNQVYDWVTAGDVAKSEIGIEIDYRDHVRRVEVSRSVLEDKAQQRFARLRDAIPPDTVVLLSARSARLPGLKQFLTHEGHDFTVLAGGAVAHGCAAFMTQLRSVDGPLRLVSRLSLPEGGRGALPPSLEESAQPTSAASSSTDNRRPTHTLTQARAVAIGAAGQPLHLSESEGGVYLEPGEHLLLNGRPVAAQTRLKAGDEITSGALQYLMICVDP